MKKKTVASLKNKLNKIFSTYIRSRDCLRTTGGLTYGLCITCGRRLPFKKLQAGHFISGRHNVLLYHEQNAHAQCYICNVIKKGNMLIYRRRVNKLYGGGTDRKLEELDKQTKQFKTYELEELIKTYSERVKQYDR